MRRCDTQQLTEESIMELIRQRGNLRFSTLMVFFHISSVEAIEIVERYQKKGILDNRGRYTPEKKSSARSPESDGDISSEDTEDGETMESVSVSEKSAEGVNAAEPRKDKGKQNDTAARQKTKKETASKTEQKEKPKKKTKTKKLIRKDFTKHQESEMEGQISLFDYMQFGR